MRAGLTHIWLMMAVLWFSLTLQWAAEDEFLRATYTGVAGLVCYLASERMRRGVRWLE